LYSRSAGAGYSAANFAGAPGLRAPGVGLVQRAGAAAWWAAFVVEFKDGSRDRLRADGRRECALMAVAVFPGGTRLPCQERHDPAPVGKRPAAVRLGLP